MTRICAAPTLFTSLLGSSATAEVCTIGPSGFERAFSFSRNSLLGVPLFARSITRSTRQDTVSSKNPNQLAIQNT